MTVRNLRVLRNRGRVTANVSFGKFGEPQMAFDVELDLGRSDVALAVSALENLCRRELRESIEHLITDEPTPEPAKKAAPRKRATRHI